MAEVFIVRPGAMLSDDRRDELKSYLRERWLQATRARTEQVDGDYDMWTKAYYGVPLEEIRTVPFYKASNFVVKIIRIYLDTFVARTLNIIYATRPVYVADGLPREFKDSWEYYLNHKALYEWEHYDLHRRLCFAGNKNGTCVVKTPYAHEEEIYVRPMGTTGISEQRVVTYDGPKSRVIPFEDFYIYPYTSEKLEDADILFHRVRYSEERARVLFDKGAWQIGKERKIEDYIRDVRDVKRLNESSDAGVTDTWYREMQCIECHLRYALTNDSTKLYNVVALLEPLTFDLIDVYFNPYINNLRIFNDYRPFPRETFFYGESLCSILAQSQEEASGIHNERRDNSRIASSVVFKRRNGATLPNPSTNWYPGKVFDLDDMDDLETIEIGRNYEDMINQENMCYDLADKISGIGQTMVGNASGQNRGGQYNTMGTIAVMAEGNQRQDTNIRDVRSVAGAIICKNSILQATYGGLEDPVIETLPDKYQDDVRQAIRYFQTDKGRFVRHEVKASDAGVNKEVERMNLVQTAQIVGQYTQVVQQMAQQMLDPGLNAGMRTLMTDIVEMHRWMATRLMREFDEADAAELLPDMQAALSAGGIQPNAGPNASAIQPGQPGQQPGQPGQLGGPAQPGGPGAGPGAAPQPVPGIGGPGLGPGGAPGTPPVAPRTQLPPVSQGAGAGNGAGRR